jgi:hypothetical protein
MHLLLVGWAGLGRLEHNCKYPRNNYELCFDVACCEPPIVCLWSYGCWALSELGLLGVRD